MNIAGGISKSRRPLGGRDKQASKQATSVLAENIFLALKGSKKKTKGSRKKREILVFFILKEKAGQQI